jgi:hypothetical protein
VLSPAPSQQSGSARKGISLQKSTHSAHWVVEAFVAPALRLATCELGQL